ncbi:MAG: tyrosine-type recombinase/integrase, partial [Patulibacter sp.]|nr:tyrosine-type recombinase/integrase [Patulibacter sp.]
MNVAKAGLAYGAAVEDLLAWLTVEKGRSRNTIAAYRADLDRLGATLLARDIAPLDATHTQLASYLASLAEDGRSIATLRRHTASIRQLFGFLVAEGRLTRDPTVDLRPPRERRAAPEALTRDEMSSLLATVRGDTPLALRDRVMLELLYASGLRVSELVSLELRHLDLEERLLLVRGKGDKERLVPFGGAALSAVRAWLLDGRPALLRDRAMPWLVLNHRGGKLSRQSVHAVVAEAGKRAGLAHEIGPRAARMRSSHGL